MPLASTTPILASATRANRTQQLHLLGLRLVGYALHVVCCHPLRRCGMHVLKGTCQTFTAAKLTCQVSDTQAVLKAVVACSIKNLQCWHAQEVSTLPAATEGRLQSASQAMDLRLLSEYA